MSHLLKRKLKVVWRSVPRGLHTNFFGLTMVSGQIVFAVCAALWKYVHLKDVDIDYSEMQWRFWCVWCQGAHLHEYRPLRPLSPPTPMHSEGQKLSLPIFSWKSEIIIFRPENLLRPALLLFKKKMEEDEGGPGVEGAILLPLLPGSLGIFLSHDFEPWQPLDSSRRISAISCFLRLCTLPNKSSWNALTTTLWFPVCWDVLFWILAAIDLQGVLSWKYCRKEWVFPSP